MEEINKLGSPRPRPGLGNNVSMSACTLVSRVARPCYPPAFIKLMGRHYRYAHVDWPRVAETG